MTASMQPKKKTCAVFFNILFYRLFKQKLFLLNLFKRRVIIQTKLQKRSITASVGCQDFHSGIIFVSQVVTLVATALLNIGTNHNQPIKEKRFN